MEPSEFVTNKEIMARMDLLEGKLDNVILKLNQAMGAWMFVKVLCSVAFGIAVIYNSLQNYLKP